MSILKDKSSCAKIKINIWVSSYNCDSYVSYVPLSQKNMKFIGESISN